MNVQKGFATVNRGRLYYETAGEGKSIVLIHGNLSDFSMWNDQFEVFSQDYKVISYDMRGFGKSSLPIEGEVYSHHEDLKELLVYLGVLEAHVLGLSMGCYVAINFVLTYPKMSTSLIATGPWVGGYDSPSVEEITLVFEPLPSITKEKGAEALTEGAVLSILFFVTTTDTLIRQIYHINSLGLPSAREKKELILSERFYCIKHFREEYNTLMKRWVYNEKNNNNSDI